jgi:hypothetical protein
MKKIILITAFFSWISVPVFSQVTFNMNQNNDGYTISDYENRIPFYSAKSINFTSFLSDSVYTKKLFIPRIPDTHIFICQGPTGKHLFSQNYYNMPCIKPIGISAPMPVLRPDQWIQLSLLIENE